MSDGDLVFSVLGPVRAWRGDAELDLGSPQQRAVLAVLLLAEGRQVDLGLLQGSLWDTEPPPSAVTTIRTYVSRLRKSLRSEGQAGGLLSLAHGYTLPVRPEAVDLRVFEQLVRQAKAVREAGDAARGASLLREALGLWRGAALAGIPGRWADGQRVRLEDLRVAALEERLALDIDLGAHVRAATELRELARADPLRERFAELLMLALYRSGRQADALTVFTAARHRLTEELGIDPGPELSRMHERILKSDQTLMPPDQVVPGHRPGAEPPGPRTIPTVRPAQLPADLPAFAGREAELALLDQILDPPDHSGAVIATIGGMGGVGKTTLALRWAHRAAGRFPDGQLYVNLRGFDPGGSALPAEEALRGFLAGLGVAPQQIPDVPDAQTGLYRTLLHDRRILIVLDNARDLSQVRPLLPGSAGCAVLITSRSPLGGLITTHDARPVGLGPLTPDQARGVLGRRLGPERLAASPVAVQQIIAHCAGLPLALAIVAARATAYRDLPLTAIAAELGAAHSRLAALSGADQAAGVRAVFSWSYHQLSPEAGTLFRLLSVHPGPDFSAGAAASLGGLPPALTGPLLTELTAAHLIAEHHPGRYSLHDLLRVYAAELSAGEDRGPDRDAAFGRLADHYLHTAHHAHELLRAVLRVPLTGPPRPGVTPEQLPGQRAALAWFSAERFVLEALIDTVAGRADFRPFAWHLTLRMQHFRQRQGYWHDWLISARLALDAAIIENDLLAQAYTRRSLAGAYRYLGRLDDALTELELARDLFAGLDYTVDDASVHANFASIYRVQCRYDLAIEHARTSLDLHEVTGNQDGMAGATEILGHILDEVGEYDEAGAHLERAVALFRERDNPRGEAYSLSGLGAVRQHQGQPQQAIDSYRQAAATAGQIGDRDVNADALTGLGDALLAAGEPAAARAAWRDALTILDVIKYTGWVTADDVRDRLLQTDGPPSPG